MKPTLAAALLVCGCSAKQEARQVLPTPIGSVLVDSVQDGELAEGDIDAFGLKLPRGVTKTAGFRDAVFASGTMPLESIANYVRERVEPRRVETGPVKTVFEHARVKGSPNHWVRVEVTSVARRIEVVVRDETPLPAPVGLSEAERRRQAGLTPDGKHTLDPGE